MLRRRINDLFRLLESDGFDNARDEILSPDNAKALDVLSDTGRIRIHRNITGAIVFVEPLSHHATYQLERREIWLNRLYGFLAGIAVTVAAEILLRVLI